MSKWKKHRSSWAELRASMPPNWNIPRHRRRIHFQIKMVSCLFKYVFPLQNCMSAPSVSIAFAHAVISDYTQGFVACEVFTLQLNLVLLDFIFLLQFLYSSFLEKLQRSWLKNLISNSSMVLKLSTSRVWSVRRRKRRTRCQIKPVKAIVWVVWWCNCMLMRNFLWKIVSICALDCFLCAMSCHFHLSDSFN